MSRKVAPVDRGPCPVCRGTGIDRMAVERLNESRNGYGKSMATVVCQACRGTGRQR